MRTTAADFWEFLDVSPRPRTRLLLVALVVPLLLSFLQPIWHIDMKAPQYPDGLSMEIWSYRLVGGRQDRDIQEINTLNHYIGMAPITREELRDLDWLPFAFIGMAMLAGRAALLGNVRDLIDLSMVAFYVLATAFVRFVYMLWRFGHELDPKAPFRTEPFMPAVLGSKQIANFTTWSWPGGGAVLVGVFAAGVWAITLVHLWRGYRQAHRSMTAAAASPAVA
jgi:hypothetical protein